MKKLLILFAALLVILPGCQKDKMEPLNFTVVYHGNGGKTAEGKTYVEQVYVGESGLVHSNFFTHSGNKDFVGWNTSSNGNGTNYAPRDEVRSNVSDLYAKWLGHYKITFHANGGTGTMNQQTVNEGESTRLSSNTFTRTGYTFEKWTTNADGSGTGYYDKAYVTLYNDLDLYAKWMAGSWLYYGDFDNHYSSWGLTYGGTMEWGVRFPANLLSSYSGASVKKCRFYAYETGSYTLKIYKGGTTEPTTLMKSQSVYISTKGWNIITLNSALALDTSVPMWVSLTNTHDQGQHPMATARAINKPDARWRRYGTNGTWTNELSNGWEDVCWEIQAYISNEKGEPGDEIMLPQCPDGQKTEDSYSISKAPTK